MRNSGLEKLIKHLILCGDTSGLREIVLPPIAADPKSITKRKGK